MLTIASSPSQLSDTDLLSLVRHVAEEERHVMAQFVELLMEVDTRRLYLAEGCSSLFTYCTQVLGLTEHAAYSRIEAARAARRFPRILAGLHDGSLTLTSIGLVASNLTVGNCDAVLEAVRNKSKREVELIVAGLQPKPDVPATVRKLPTHVVHTTPMVVATPAISPARDGDATATGEFTIGVTVPAAAISRVDAILMPLAPERFKLQLTISRATYDKLQQVRDLLRHSVPNGDLEAVFDLAITRLLEHCQRVKTAKTDRPRHTKPCATRTRRVPAAVKRAVWARDGGRCAFRGTQGRCREVSRLEFHHVIPFAAGGTTEPANLELRCRAHNDYEAQQWFGGNGRDGPGSRGHPK